MTTLKEMLESEWDKVSRQLIKDQITEWLEQKRQKLNLEHFPIVDKIRQLQLDELLEELKQ